MSDIPTIDQLKEIKESYCKFKCHVKVNEDIILEDLENYNCLKGENIEFDEVNLCAVCEIDRFIEELYQNK